ncbi:MAG: hypothetical protein ACYDCK_06760 [Thermoplasmatota archaeon]
MPSFTAHCERCRADRTFEEFMRERRAFKSAGAANRGDFKFEMEYKFRCTVCGERYEKLLGADGKLHKWTGNKHIVQNVQGG